MKKNLPVTKDELKAEIAKLATKDELKAEIAKLATKKELEQTEKILREEIRLTAEECKGRHRRGDKTILK